jgi:hypothetical protein
MANGEPTGIPQYVHAPGTGGSSTATGSGACS